MISSLQLIDSLSLWRYWIFKALLGFKIRYRGTKLKVLWPVLSTLVVVLVIGIVWGVLLEKDDLPAYFLYLITGYSIWTVISGVLEQTRNKLLLYIVIGLKLRMVVNFHSLLGWVLFSKFDDRLMKWTSLYAYTLCYHLNILGKKRIAQLSMYSPAHAINISVANLCSRI